MKKRKDLAENIVEQLAMEERNKAKNGNYECLSAGSLFGGMRSI